MQTPGTIRELLQSEGIRTTKDLNTFTFRESRKGECSYDVLVRKFGQSNADKIMRLAEVAEWDFNK